MTSLHVEEELEGQSVADSEEYELSPVWTVFQRKWREFGINEFPSGKGSWRPDSIVNSQRRFSATLKEPDAKHFIPEELKELLTSQWSPWRKETDWSEEAESLRILAIDNQKLTTLKAIISQFETLRFVDQNICEIDANVRKFTNLKSLVLAANRLDTVDAQNLPPSLEVLELYANEIHQIDSLGKVLLPNIKHLGLGMNRIGDLKDIFKTNTWYNLLSVDLSSNDLTDLDGTIQLLKGIPTLRNLLLCGNPFALTCHYRGTVIDALPQLKHLDDVYVSSDDRIKFKTMQHLSKDFGQVAEMILVVNSLKNVPIPEESLNANASTIPRIVNRYFVDFAIFTEDEPKPVDVDESNQNEPKTPSVETTKIDEWMTIPGQEKPVLVEHVRTEFMEFSPEPVETYPPMIRKMSCSTAFRDFLKSEVKISVKIDRMVWDVPPPPPAPPTPKKSDKKSGKQSPVKAPPQSPEKSTKKPGKQELVVTSKTESEVASFWVPLSTLLQGGVIHETVLHRDLSEQELATLKAFEESKKKKKGQAAKAPPKAKGDTTQPGTPEPPRLDLRVSIKLKQFENVEEARESLSTEQ